MELGDRHQTTSREATNDPGNDNLNALKNAHLTPRAIKAIQSGKDIKNEDSTEDSTTDGRKRKPAPKPIKREALKSPVKRAPTKSTQPRPNKPVKRSPEAPRRASSKPQPVRRTKSAPKKAKAPEKSYSTSIGLLDLIRMN